MYGMFSEIHPYTRQTLCNKGDGTMFSLRMSWNMVDLVFNLVDERDIYLYICISVCDACRVLVSGN